MTPDLRPPAGFEPLVQQARADGATDPRNLPFFLPGLPGVGGLLLIHGFSASPWEMRLLGEKLAFEGFTVLGVRLPGHGTSPEDLELRRLEEWQAAVREGFDLLASCCQRVYAVGQSTGAMLALDLCRERQPAGLLLLSPFLRVRQKLAPFARWLWPLHRWRVRPLLAGSMHAYYPRQPVRAVAQLNRLLRLVRRQLPAIDRPVLLLGTDGDVTIDPYSAIPLFRQLGSKDRALHLFGPDVPHVLTSDLNPRLADVLKLCRMFLQRLESGPSAG